MSVPTTKWNMIGMSISLVVKNGWKLHEMDAKSAFFNGESQEEVYMT
jgi:hypothetical protein